MTVEDCSSLVALTEEAACNSALAGAKAAHLAQLRRVGLPVPTGFVIPPTVDPAAPKIRAAVAAAFEALRAMGAETVAVRSSATAEDLPDASFAGQQATVLDVRDRETLFEAIDRVRASLHSEATTAYRERIGIEQARMAVLVQRQIDARASGAAFGRDPISGEPTVVIEAVSGLGNEMMAGHVTPRVWHVWSDGRIVEWSSGRVVEWSGRQRGSSEGPPDHQTTRPPDDVTLPRSVIEEVVRLVRTTEEAFGTPQDVEWVWDGEQVWVVQARPITVRRDRDFFTTYHPDDTWLWTSTFLNERFTHPVSPLGWTIVAGPLERLALRSPLSLLDANDLEGPLLKLWRGHPYSRVAAWQRIYKLFPDGALPEDAVRYFPEGDTSLRAAPRRPRWGLHLLLNGLRILLFDGGGALPIHNPAAWREFERRLDAWLDRLAAEEATLAHQPTESAIRMGRRMLHDAQSLTEELLRIHRWSLLYADLSYSVLRRLLRARFGPANGARRAAALTADVRSKTTQLNDALDVLAEIVNRRQEVTEVLAAVETMEDLIEHLGDAHPFVIALRAFLDRYGHRFFSLDLADPPYEAAPEALFPLLQARTADTRRPARARAEPTQAWLRPVVRWARDYVRLREDQRFAWQRILAVQRRIALHLGQRWAAEGLLAEAENVFGLTWEELTEEEMTPERGNRAAERCDRRRRLREQYVRAPGWHYPDFLRGTRPLVAEGTTDTLRGRPVSPGVARGRVCIVTSPDEFDRVQQGDILVTMAPDPGWTPIFGTIAGLITERGGQLSHAAVVAREYRLPAVAGIAGLLNALQSGEEVLVDGTEGLVRRLNEGEQRSE